MAVFTHLETDTGTNVDISSATAVGAYTANGDKLVMCDVSIDAVAGNGDYVMYVKRQVGGSGSAYIILPKTTMAAASGETAISGQSGWITVRNKDVLTCYVDGLAGDTSTPDWTTRWFELAGVTAAAVADAICDEALSGHTSAGTLAKAIADIESDATAILEDTGTTLDGLIKDVPTVSEFEARTKPAADYFDPAADTVANVTAVGTTTNLTNLPTMPADWLTAAGVKADAVTKLQANLALEATLTAIKGAGWTTESLKVIRDALTAVQADLDNPNQYKADVSALATTAHLQEVEDKVDTIDTVADEIKLKTDKIPAVPAQAGEYTAAIAAIPTTPLLAANYTAPDNASISAIKAKTDTIPASPAVAGEYTASIAAIQADLDNPNQYKADVSGIPDAILAKVVVDTLTLKQVLKVLAAIEIGTTTGGGTPSFTYTGKDGTTVQLTGVDE